MTGEVICDDYLAKREENRSNIAAAAAAKASEIEHLENYRWVMRKFEDGSNEVKFERWQHLDPEQQDSKPWTGKVVYFYKGTVPMKDWENYPAM